MGSPYRVGILLMLAASACIGIQGFFVKIAARDLHPVTLAFLRFLVSYLLMHASMRAGLVEVRPANRRILWLRGILGGFGSLLLFLAVTHTRLSNAVVLFYTYPIFMALLTRFIYGASHSTTIVVAFLASFFGIYLIVQPTFDTVVSGDLFALMGALTAAGALVSLKVSRATETSWTVFHYYNIAGIVVTAPLLAVYWTTPTTDLIPVLSAVLLFSILGQLGTTYAYRFTSAVEGGVVSMFGAVVGSALGILALHESATPHFLAGASLVLSAGIYLTIRGTEERRAVA